MSENGIGTNVGVFDNCAGVGVDGSKSCAGTDVGGSENCVGTMVDVSDNCVCMRAGGSENCVGSRVDVSENSESAITSTTTDEDRRKENEKECSAEVNLSYECMTSLAARGQTYRNQRLLEKQTEKQLSI